MMSNLLWTQESSFISDAIVSAEAACADEKAAEEFFKSPDK